MGSEEVKDPSAVCSDVRRFPLNDACVAKCEGRFVLRKLQQRFVEISENSANISTKYISNEFFQ